MRSELEKKLKKVKVVPEVIANILNECERLGDLDDQRERSLLISRGKKKGLGPHMIAYAFEQKAPEFKKMVREKITDEEQREMIKKWIKKKTPNNCLDELKVKGSLYRFLRRKGFDDHLICEELFTP